MPRRVTIDAAEPGLRLAEAVLNRQGQVLLTKGTELEDRHLRILKTWGVTGLVVEGGENGREEEGDESTELTEEVVRRAIARVARRMNWKPRNPWEKQAQRLAVMRAAHLVMKTGK